MGRIAPRARIAVCPQRIRQFLGRHRISIPLALASACCFAVLARELRTGNLGAVDQALAKLVARSRGSIDAWMLFLTELGSFFWMTALAALSALGLFFGRRPKDAMFMAVSAAGTGVCNSLLKLGFQRARPSLTDLYLLETPASFSFPSGHAMGSAGVLLSLLVILHVNRVPIGLRIGAGGLLALTLVGIAYSRVYFGVHFASDVVGGILAGAACVSATAGSFYPGVLPGENRKLEGSRRTLSASGPQA